MPLVISITKPDSINEFFFVDPEQNLSKIQLEFIAAQFFINFKAEKVIAKSGDNEILLERVA